jgi:hypothetical protein
VDARTGLVIGGATAVAASIAVVTAVALANTVALADAAGTSIATQPIVVPSSGSPSATPQPTATIAPPVESAAAPGPEVVEAPAPVVVDTPRSTGDAGTPSAPVTVPPPATPADLETVIAASKAAGNWDAVRTWAAANGWPAGRTEALVKQLQRELAAESSKLVAPSAPADSVEQRRGLVAAEPEQRQAIVDAQPEQRSLEVEVEVESGSIEAEQVPATTPGKPAHAGSNVEHGNGAAHGEKKAQSRNPPDKRD